MKLCLRFCASSATARHPGEAQGILGSHKSTRCYHALNEKWDPDYVTGKFRLLGVRSVRTAAAKAASTPRTFSSDDRIAFFVRAEISILAPRCDRYGARASAGTSRAAPVAFGAKLSLLLNQRRTRGTCARRQLHVHCQQMCVRILPYHMDGQSMDTTNSHLISPLYRSCSEMNVLSCN